MKAVDDISAAIRFDKDPLFFLERAEYVLAIGDYDFAIRDTTQAIDLDKQLARAYAVRGTANTRKKEFSQATVDFDEAFKLNPALTWVPAARQRAQDAMASADSFEDYVKVLLARVEAQKRYPREAIRDGQEGRVIVDLVITRDGKLASMVVRESSGYQVLDDDVRQVISDAQPFPPLWDRSKERQQITLPVRYRLGNPVNDPGK